GLWVFTITHSHNSEAISILSEDYIMKIQNIERYAACDGNLKKERSLLATGRFHIALALFLLFPALSAYAQFESASVLGYAKDTSGAAIPNGAVTLTNTATGIAQKATTDTEGRYEFSSIPIGTYTVVAEAQG